MMYCEHDSLDFIKPSKNRLYNPSIASSASSSSASVWSETSSQSSDDTTISAVSVDSLEPCVPYACSRPPLSLLSNFQCRKATGSGTSRLQQQSEVPPEQRQNPRRTSSGATTRTGCPPPLVRQSDRKLNFVDSLVDSSTQIVEAIWPLSSVFHRQELGPKAVLPLRTFIQETLRRSRTSYSTLQVALYYLILIKPHVPKHDFTMEQPDDVHTSRVLQCGRRMFLAALILASKYLQDRNYSARAWSKISGLATQEINQNEMAFLLAVNWKLHITDDVFKRWTDIVLKYTPSQPPSSGPVCSQASEQQNQDWRNLILQLDPGLDNIEDLIPLSPLVSRTRDSTPVSPLSSLPSLPLPERPSYTSDPSTPKAGGIPFLMEPAPAAVCTPGRLAPAMGLLPTPRLTPQSIGFSTPAASAASYLLNGKGSMGMAMAQAATLSASQSLDRWPGCISASPQSYVSTRRSSLANSISTVSSPESMVSDSSRTSRSSSISSASSLVSAPSTKLDVQARCRYAKLCGERYNLRPAIASVPEDYEESCITSSPESYTSTVGKDFVQMSLDTPLARRGCEMDDVTSAARALQELHRYHQRTNTQSCAPRLSAKRSRPSSMDIPLQENVREMLNNQYRSFTEREWIDAVIGCCTSPDSGSQRTPVLATHGGRKRVCCSSDTRSYVIPPIHPAVGGLGGPGMWEGILN
ncbi:hypothetical protein GGS23DRAFT_183421 [Durotheca rogersii]|uniref:uncharacterized protein n=1 Tax=Durotheca rogersii TaxID=419775 RepID=UPI00222101C9|nr:uncharacterized protein GGS23DRAFT_183421 [Durotheca rogersii]KAI5867576.1 hypothetical protein GGS23DRAFT_183421 [Durotheca rogersii]